MPDQTTPASEAAIPEDSSPAGPRRRELVAEALVPGILESPPGQRRRKVLWTLAIGAVVGLLAWLVPAALDYFVAEPTTRHSKQVEENLDREGPAFTASTRVDPDPLYMAYVLDRPLTRSEVATFLESGSDGPSIEAVEELAATHSGHGLENPGWDEAGGYSSSWLIDLFSDRSAGLAITGVRAKDLRCGPATAKTVILVRPEGGGAYDGIHFNLSESKTPYSLSPDDYFGKPYFSHKKIDLGNGAEPGGLRASFSSGVQDCDFLLEAEYRDSLGVHQQEIKDAAGRFAVRGLPANPYQFFLWTKVGVLDCGPHQFQRPRQCPAIPFSVTNWSSVL
ncbi:hypothetical protein ABT185_16395 [Streptomyces clavifer]|uniref:hypothetical protein n=1 Tax=Streptomyces clavifer TaxID=68188 RepID=UPI00332CEBDC